MVRKEGSCSPAYYYLQPRAMGGTQRRSTRWPRACRSCALAIGWCAWEAHTSPVPNPTPSQPHPNLTPPP